MKIRITAFIMALIFLFVIAGCSVSGDPPNENSSDVDTDSSYPEENPEYPVISSGADLYSRPGIIVSLAPSLTEKLFDLGFQDRLEGISDYCDDADDKGRVRCGTAQLPDLKEIENLSPHLLLTETELLEDDLISVQQMGVEVAVIRHAETIEQLKENYLVIATMLDGKKTGAAVGEAFNNKLQRRVDLLAQNALEEPKNAVYLRLLDFTVATGDKLEGRLMELIGLNNIAKDYKDWIYPEDEAKSEEGRKNFASIEYIFCDKRSVTIKMLEQSDFYKGLSAVIKDRYLYIDSSAFERQSLSMFDELERMEMYAKGEIPGSKEEEQS